MRLKPLLRLLFRNHISFTPRSISRVAFLLQSAMWSSLFARAEQIKYSRILKNIPLPTNPVFIVGHWRTGSTFLHQLLGKDPQNTVPTLFQVAVPEGYLVSYRFYQPIMKRLLGRYRPMDYVEIGFDEPQEDEYALYRLSGFSPLEKLVFPEKKGYFVTTCQSFLPEDTDRDNWNRHFLEFYRKLSIIPGKRIISKNPFNSLRIPVLAELFPDACFIHIVRHPYDVIPSTRHLWQVIQSQNTLNRNTYIPGIEETSQGLLKIVDRIQQDMDVLPKSHWIEVRYEDMENDPVKCIREIYRILGFTFTEVYGQILQTYLEQLAGFRKNKFYLSEKDTDMIKEILNEFMIRFNYS